MRQLIYISRAAGFADQEVLDDILEQSRHNNAIDGLSGLLWADGEQFLQVLEGSVDAIRATMERITADPRHRDIELLVDRTVDGREFGGWSMEHRSRGDIADAIDARIRRMLAASSGEVREAFEKLVPQPV